MKRFFGIILSVIMIMSIFTLPLSVVSSASTPGIVLSEDDITLEVGEACVVSANRYGFTSAQATTNLTWSKTPGAGTDGNWISYGQHGVRRQNEAYYIKANEVGMGTVKVALKNGTSDVYYDILNVTVIPKKDVIIEKDGIEVTSPVDLSADSSAVLNATATGCTSPDITWESSDSAIVSLSEVSGNSVTVTREGFSNIPVIIKATVTDSDGISHSKSVYVSTASENTQPLRINSSKIVTDSATNQKTITVEQGETLTLSSSVSDALDGTATVWNATAGGVDSHLSAMPSTEDIQRIMDFSGLSFDPVNDRVIWYEIKRISDDSAGLPNWHVDGVLVKDEQAILTYDKNTSSGGVSNMPNPPATICDTGNTVDITTSVPTSSTMSFIGWNTKPDGSGDWYTATGSLYQNFEGTADTQIILTEDTTLYAIWAGTTICVNWEGSEPHSLWDAVFLFLRTY